MHKYKVVIHWSDEDETFIAEAPELPGCMAHGDSPSAALLHCQEAIDLWLDTAAELGRAIPQPEGSRLRPA